LGSSVVVWRWVWVARSREWWRQAICIWRWAIVLAIGSCRRRILIAGVSRILMMVSKFNRVRQKGSSGLTGYCGGGYWPFH